MAATDAFLAACVTDMDLPIMEPSVIAMPADLDLQQGPIDSLVALYTCSDVLSAQMVDIDGKIEAIQETMLGCEAWDAKIILDGDMLCSGMIGLEQMDLGLEQQDMSF
jgi:hypothetical protein